MGNQYFQFAFREGKAYLHFYPPTNGGLMVEKTEVFEYLDQRRYFNYNKLALSKAIDDFENESEIFIGPWDGIEVAEAMGVVVSGDNMKVVCRFYPSSAKGRRIDAREILETLTLKHIKYGLRQQAIFDFLQNRQYCKDYVFAKGLKPTEGTNASIEYFFNTNINLQPKRNEDGSVDYKDLNTISHVKSGDLLARLTKAVKGQPGKNVLGEEISPRDVEDMALSFGRNITVNEELTEIYSDVNGHVSLMDGKVFVSNVYEVPADVDNSTGNINYDGSVNIKGNVKTGFCVHALGDIIVEGCVEGGTLITEGQIIVKRGVHGMLKGELRAGKNVMAKFIENANVIAGGYVEAEMILNSDVSASDLVRVKGKKGLISGGSVKAKNLIEADNVGSDMGTATEIQVGVEPAKKERFIELKNLSAELTETLEEKQVVLANYTKILKKGERLPKDKMQYVQKLAVEVKELTTRYNSAIAEMETLKNDMRQNDKSLIKIYKTINPGVNVSISDLSYNMKDTRNCVRIVKREGEIRFENV